MNPRRAVATAALFSIVLLGACDQGRRGSRAPALTLRPAAPSVARGDAVQMYVVATYPDGRLADVTGTMEWTSSAPAIATVGNAPGTQGRVEGHNAGTTTIRARDPRTANSTSVVLTVRPAALVSVAVTPSNPSIALGTTRQFTATGTYSDATTQDLTPAVTWSSSATGVATISNAASSEGLATSAGTGSTTITATHPGTGVTGATTLTVTPAVLVSLAVTPSTPSIALGTTRQFTATGTYSDATTQDLTPAVTWSSSATGVATISNAASSEGLATSAGTGSTTITATHPGTGVTGATTLTVTPAVLVSLAVTPSTPSIALGTTRQFTATGTYSDATTQDLTSAVTWSSSATGVATISNAASSEGLATSAGTGSTTITATHPGTGVTGTTTLTVTPAVLVSLAVTPSTPSIALGTTRQFTATGTYSDATTQDLTSAVTWSSSATGVATISNAASSEGLATSAGTGSTTITATHPGTGVTGATTLTVTPAVLVSLAVTPSTPSIALGTTRQFTATGTYSDATTQDLTSAVTWSSSATGVATISNAASSEGLATSAGTGSTTITATHPGTGVTGATTLTVTPAVLVSLAVTPSTPSIALGTTRQFTATGTYSDATTQDLTSAVTWSSSATGVATISNAASSEGLATSAGTGSTTITATHPGTGVTGTTTLTVFDQITFLSASSTGAASGTSLAIAAPTGVQANDVLVAAIAVRPNTASATPPSGWTLVRRIDNAAGAANSLLVYYRVASASEGATYTWTFSSTTGIAGGIAAFRFVDTSNPVDVENGLATASSVTHATPSVTTTTAHTMLVGVFGFSSSATWTSPAGMTEAVDVASQASGATGISVSLHYAVQAAAGATGTKSATASNDADTGNTELIALRRAP